MSSSSANELARGLGRAAEPDPVNLRTPAEYRPDIDGLRAIAVLSVVLYHAFPSALPGGFAGVDIFFVISGFLITRILSTECARGDFSLLRFYERRIRRILPALFVLIAATVAIGYLLLQPGDYLTFARSASWTIGFLANFFFWQNTGYFDALSETMPLLHTWSLAVEEQFYLVWPLLILALWKWTRFKGLGTWATLLLVTFVSLVACIYLTFDDPKSAFYLPFTRAWELSAGGLLWFGLTKLQVSSKRMKFAAPVVGWLGLAMIGFTVLLLSDAQPFPGYLAVVPVAGTMLVIASGGLSPNIPSRLLSTRPAVFVGKLSYSLYLWHWPVLTFYRHFEGGGIASPLVIFALIIVSIGLAYLSWILVEQPLRYAKARRVEVLGAGAFSAEVVLLLALGVVSAGGFPERLPPEAHRMADQNAMWAWACPEKRSFTGLTRRRCVVGTEWDNAEHHALLWGDSHALHFAPLIDRIARKSNYAVLLYDSCPPYLDNSHIQRSRNDLPTYSSECGREHRELISFMEQDDSIGTVILASAWAMYTPHIHGPDGVRSERTGLELMREGILRVAGEVDTSRRRVVVLTEVPRPGRDMVPCVLQRLGGLLRKRCSYDPTQLELDSVRAVHGSVNDVLWSLADTDPAIDVIDVTRSLCGTATCDTFLNGEFLYRDSNHLRRNLSPATMDQLISKIGLAGALSPNSEAIAGQWSERYHSSGSAARSP